MPGVFSQKNQAHFSAIVVGKLPLHMQIRAGQFKKNSGHELRVNSSHRDDHFLLYNMGLCFNPRGARRPPIFRFSQETANQKYENRNGRT